VVLRRAGFLRERPLDRVGAFGGFGIFGIDIPDFRRLAIGRHPSGADQRGQARPRGDPQRSHAVPNRGLVRGIKLGRAVRSTLIRKRVESLDKPKSTRRTADPRSAHLRSLDLATKMLVVAQEQERRTPGGRLPRLLKSATSRLRFCISGRKERSWGSAVGHVAIVACERQLDVATDDGVGAIASAAAARKRPVLRRFARPVRAVARP
jgi:hypothetical protein